MIVPIAKQLEPLAKGRISEERPSLHHQAGWFAARVRIDDVNATIGSATRYTLLYTTTLPSCQ